MPTISRRLRSVVRPTQESTETEDLRALRERTRAVLNRPYRFEPRTILKPWETQGSDPFVGLFKPFSEVVPVTAVSTAATTLTKTYHRSWMLIIPVVLLGLGLAALIIWQAWHFGPSLSGLFPGFIKPPSVRGVVSQTATATPLSIPSGTILQPGGSYAGSTVPPSSSSSSLRGGPPPATNINQSWSRPSSAGGTSSGGTTNGASTGSGCPSGFVCSGSDLGGTPCTTSGPCREVAVSSLSGTALAPLAQSSQFILNNEPTCPCVLIH